MESRWTSLQSIKMCTITLFVNGDWKQKKRNKGVQIDDTHLLDPFCTKLPVFLVVPLQRVGDFIEQMCCFSMSFPMRRSSDPICWPEVRQPDSSFHILSLG